jgi:hypothetical protein
MTGVIIGVDPHKASHTAVAVSAGVWLADQLSVRLERAPHGIAEGLFAPISVAMA